MSSIPIFRLGLDRQFDRVFVIATNLLKLADIDFTDSLEPTFGRIFQSHSKNIPVIGEWQERQATH